MEERLMRVLREVVYILKRIGPKMEPCDTPKVKGSEGERLGRMKQLICEMIGMQGKFGKTKPRRTTE